MHNLSEASRRLTSLGSMLAILFAVGISGCGSKTVEVTGNVTYRQGIALPPACALVVELEDVTRADQPANIVAQVIDLTAGRQVPLQYRLVYEASKIEANHTYGLHAHILGSQGEVLFISQGNVPLTAPKAANAVDIEVKQVERAAPPPTIRSPELRDTYWRLVDLEGRLTLPGLEDREPHLRLKSVDSRVSGTGGVNALVGGFARRGDSLRFTPAASTRMAGPPELMAQEAALFEAMSATRNYRVVGRTLELVGDGKVVARFEAKVEE